MAILANLVRTYITSLGTGALTLGGAVPGFLTPAQAGITTNVVVSYAIIDGVQSEVGRGVYNTALGTVARGPLFSTNGNAAINVTATAEFVITFLNEDKLDIETAIGGRILNAANQVTNANLNVMISQNMKGRLTTGTGNVEDLTPAQVRQILGFANVKGTGGQPYNRIVAGNLIVLGCSAVVTTNAGGEAQVAYPVAFPNADVFVVIQNGDPGSSGQSAVISQRSDLIQNASSFVVRMITPTGALATTVRLNYIAIGAV